MLELTAPQAPPFCPNPECHFHRSDGARWRYLHDGFFARHRPPHVVQRYRCSHCGRRFSDQTFRTTYWLKRPELLQPVFWHLLGCCGFRQIAREFAVSPSTPLTHAARLGRHCLLVHEQLRPRGSLTEPLALDSFISFELSQYHPTAFHLAAGQQSHFLYGFTESELRRSGRMTRRQRRRRAVLEARYGRPQPRAVERDVAELLNIVAPRPQTLELHSDEHTDYPRALGRLGHLTFNHRTISSRAARTSRNPLFAINLMDLLIRHSGANHKRETIAFSKRRQSAAERLAVFLVWRNYVKSFSERARDGTPAMRLGILEQRLTARELLARRLFPSRVELPQRWAKYYWREVGTRRIAHCATHRLRYAA
jgi:transposase-like protein